jgi:hypothetical protein
MNLRLVANALVRPGHLRATAFLAKRSSARGARDDSSWGDCAAAWRSMTIALRIAAGGCCGRSRLLSLDVCEADQAPGPAAPAHRRSRSTAAPGRHEHFRRAGRMQPSGGARQQRSSSSRASARGGVISDSLASGFDTSGAETVASAMLAERRCCVANHHVRRPLRERARSRPRHDGRAALHR